MNSIFSNRLKKEWISPLIIAHQEQIKKGQNELYCLNSLSFEPKPWQIESALRTLRDLQGNALLADEVGLGKTIEAGLILKELLHRKLIQKILILVPAPLVEQWKNEMLDKFSLSFFDVRDKGWENESLLICSIPLATRSSERRESLLEKQFDLVIVDEAHCLKNHQTSTYKFVYSLHRKNTILMSATPFQNDLRELYNLVNILKPGFLKSRKAFREEYMQNRFLPKNVKKLKQLLSQIMIRHRRKDTLVGLPQRHVQTQSIELSKNEHEFYYDVISFCQTVYQKYIKGSIHVGWDSSHVNIFTLVLISLLKQNTSSPQSVVHTLQTKVLPRLEEDHERSQCKSLIEKGQTIAIPSKMIELSNRIKAQKEKVIVYSEYLDTIDTMYHYLESQGIPCVTYHGKMTSDQKQQALYRFQYEEPLVFISSESGGQGLNLQFCHQIFNYDLPWNPMRIEQRIGRVHRFGQTKAVQIHMLPTKGTIDEYLLYILTSKVQLFELVIGELDTIMSYMVNQDTSMEFTIGTILLESSSPEEIEEKLRNISEQFLKAKEDFEHDQKENEAFLQQLEVNEHE